MAGACCVTTVTVTQGLAGPPGPSGPALKLSKEELRVSGAAWGWGAPGSGGCCLLGTKGQ